MRLNDVWSEQGVYVAEGGIPTGLRVPILVPDNPSRHEAAALIELVGRIGLQCLPSQTVSYENLVQFGIGDAKSKPEFAHSVRVRSESERAEVGEAQIEQTESRLSAPLCIVVAERGPWLAQTVQTLAGHEDMGAQSDSSDGEIGDAEGSAIFAQRAGMGVLVVVTGDSGPAVLQAARTLASVSPETDVELPLDGKPVVCSVASSEVPLAASHPSSAGVSQQNSVSRNDVSLHSLFSTEGMMRVPSGELYPEFNGVFEVASSALETISGMVELAFHAASAAGSVCFPLTAVDEPGRGGAVTVRCDVLPDGDDDRVRLEDDENGSKDAVGAKSERESCAVVISAASSRLVDFVRYLVDTCFGTPSKPGNSNWRARLAAICSPAPDIAEAAELDFRLHTLLATSATTSSEIQYAAPKASDASETPTDPKATGLWRVIVPESAGRSLAQWPTLTNLAREGALVERPPAKPLYTANWEDAGELADVQERLFALLASMELCEDVTVDVWTSVDEDAFDSWAAIVGGELGGRAKTAGIPQFRYHDANKAGLDFVLRDVLPELRKLRADSPGAWTVELSAREFLPSDRHVDLRHRFLQELFPADVLLAERLDLSVDEILVDLHEAGPMFQVRVRDDNEHLLAEFSFEGFYESRPYMLDFPDFGLTAVPMAGFQISKHDAILVRQVVDSNPLRFWKWYQSQLPLLANFAAPGVPKFLQLTCDVWMNAPERRLGFRDEVTSVLEALHEDMYFWTLHWFSQHGERADEKGWEAPGAVLPFIHNAEAVAPRAEIRVYGFEPALTIAVVTPAGQRVALRAGEADFRWARVTELRRTNDGRLNLTITGVPEEFRQTLGVWLTKDVVAPQQDASGQHARAQSALAYEALESALPDADFTKSVTRDVLQNHDVVAWLRTHQASLPGQVVQLDWSFGGEPIVGVELFSGNSTRGASLVKHSLYKPTWFINARHHANEVSSTNAALMLLEKISQHNELLQRLNIVIIPVQNVDGAYIHEQMMAEHPYWKLHSARYNACGLEFTRYYFDSHARFGESRTYQTVWDRWRPDVVLDDHGVPSHEWIQPFSGYSSGPTFPVSYWIPNARMYTIWNELDSSFAGDETRTSIRKLVSKRLQDDEVIEAENQFRLKLFQKWGHRFDEVMHPVELTNGNITYIWNVKPDANAKSLLRRYPQWVTSDIITEVNDETVHDDELFACADAHHRVHMAILEWFSGVESQVRITSSIGPNGVTRLTLSRQRPLVRIDMASV